MAQPSVDTLEHGTYSESLYRVSGMLPLCPDLTPTESVLAQYRSVGVIGIERAFDQAKIDAVKDAFRQLVSLGIDQPDQLPPRIELQFERDAAHNLADLGPDERCDQVRKLMWFVDADPRFIDMANDPSLLAMVEACTGFEVEMYQEMALFKPPSIGREKPWHQDNAYFNVPEGTPVVGVWIALDAATLENGCMHFLLGQHVHGPRPHFNIRDWQLCDTDIEGETIVAAPIPEGGALIFDGLAPHGTPKNTSGARRRALQFHYVPKGTPRTDSSDRLRIFGAEGFGATC